MRRSGASRRCSPVTETHRAVESPILGRWRHAVTRHHESPFARAEPVVAQEGDTVVVVQPGASLWRIARHSYGTGMRYTVIYEANRTQIRNPDLIYPGQVFVVPPTQAGG